MSSTDAEGIARTTDDLWERLLDGVGELPDRLVTASEVNAQTVAKMSQPTGGRRMRMRLTGKSVRQNRVSVKTAAGALTSLQETVSSIGAALSDAPTLFGQISGEIRRATEMQLTPVIAPGSVVFTLLTDVPEDEGSLFEPAVVSTLLDESLGALLHIFEEVAEDNLSESEIVTDVKRLGPRAAKHLQGLSDIVIGDDVAIELDWGVGTDERRTAILNRRSASFLKEIIRRNAIDISEETFEGTLVTVSTVDPAAIVLDDGEKIPLRLNPESEIRLVGFFDRRVRVHVRVSVRRSVTTGRESATYDLLAIDEVGRP